MSMEEIVMEDSISPQNNLNLS